MTESVLSNQSSKSNRLDPAHDLLSSGADATAVSASDAHSCSEPNPWMAFAGRDPECTTQQVDRQASELLSYVQEQNKEIDVRQAELNAKLAQLDNQLRNARLRSIDDSGTDLLSDATNMNAATHVADAVMNPEESKATDAMLDSGLDLEQLVSQSSPANKGFAVADLGYMQEKVTSRVSHEPGNQEFEEVERLVAQFTDADASDSAIEDLWNHDPDSQFVENVGSDVEQNASKAAATQPAATPQSTRTVPTREHVDAFPSMLAGSHLRRVDTLHSSDSDSLESERRLLADRKLELDRQHAVLNRMQEETQSLHREALEMRIVTEQLWGQLSESMPAEKLQELIASLRARLDMQYSNEQTTLEQRKDEIVSMQELLTEKQSELRAQSGRMQDWFTSRQDEIKTYANEVDARAMLLDRREQRLQDEFAKWEGQRKAYEQQLQGLVQKLKLNGISM